jgi:hypothetical protein
MAKQRMDVWEDFDRIAGGIQGGFLEMLEWLRAHDYGTLQLYAVARAWERWAAENSLVFEREIPRDP